MGNYFEVKDYCMDMGIDTDFRDMLVVITNPTVKDYISSYMHPSVKYIVARRTINYNNLNKLISIPAGTEVLLVNDVRQTCYDTINQLKLLGIDHIDFYPYYLGIESYKKLKFAVTPGESALAPNCVTELIDISTRLIDITTLVEIFEAIGMLNERGSEISAQYIKNIIEISKQYNNVANESIRLKNMFETILDNSNDGILYIGLDGKISAVNEGFSSLIRLDKDYI